MSGVRGECDDYRNQKIKHKHLEAKQEGRIFGKLVQKIKMKVRCWNVHILTATLILLIAVSNECIQSQSGGNRSKIDKSTQKDSSDGKLFIISTNDETQNKKNSANVNMCYIRFQ